MKVIFIRHGESAGNADIPSFDLARIPLTQKGQAQADVVAAGWKVKPSLIVTSPYLRAQSTAQATIKRFIDVPVQMLSIHEFVYLDPAVWGGSTHAQRRPAVEAYWNRGDLNYVSGDGAESFRHLLGRIRDAFRWFGQLDGTALVYAFGHGQFMQAARLLISHAAASEIEIMRTFADLHDSHPIANGETVTFTKLAGSDWCLEGHQMPNGLLPTL